MKTKYLLPLLPLLILIFLFGCDEKKKNTEQKQYPSFGEAPIGNEGQIWETDEVPCSPRDTPPIEYDPASPAYEALNLGYTAISAQDFEGALKHYQKAATLDSMQPGAFYGMAYAYTELGDPLEAIYYYSKTIQVDSTYRKSYYNRAFESMGQGQFQDALADLDIAIAQDPDDGELYVNRGICKYNLGDTDGACADWSRVCPELRTEEVMEYYNETCR